MHITPLQCWPLPFCYLASITSPSLHTPILSYMPGVLKYNMIRACLLLPAYMTICTCNKCRDPIFFSLLSRCCTISLTLYTIFTLDVLSSFFSRSVILISRTLTHSHACKMHMARAAWTPVSLSSIHIYIATSRTLLPSPSHAGHMCSEWPHGPFTHSTL